MLSGSWYSSSCFTGAVCLLWTCDIKNQPIPVSLFSNSTADFRPIVTKSRRHTEEDRKFIATEVCKLLDEGIVMLSDSPWCA